MLGRHAPGTASAAPAIKHVFVIVVENEGFNQAFGPGSQAPYLSQTLTSQGELLSQYYGIGHNSLDNYLAMISGQAPNLFTQGDCPFYTNVFPGAATTGGQVIGQGCVYPASVATVANQLSAANLTWKGYMEDMGNSATEPATCGHPPLNSVDRTQRARPGDQYAARHDPFVYFHSIIDTSACNADVVPLTQLSSDLAAASSTPNYAFITPNLCNDGHDSPCVDGSPGGLPAADAFLKAWVPRITGSPAWSEAACSRSCSTSLRAATAAHAATSSPAPTRPAPAWAEVLQGPAAGAPGPSCSRSSSSPARSTRRPTTTTGFCAAWRTSSGSATWDYAGQSGLQGFGADVYNGP